MFRIFLAVIVCVFIFSIFQLFHVIELANSHPSKDRAEATRYNKLPTLMDNKERNIVPRLTRLAYARSVVEDLNTSWSNNEAAIKAGNEVTITAAINTLFSTIGAITTGGTSMVATVAVTGPAFMNAATTYKEASKTDSARLKRSEFVKAYSKALEGYDAAIAFQKTGHDAYTDLYFEFLQMEVDHGGGLYTDVNDSALSVE